MRPSAFKVGSKKHILTRRWVADRLGAEGVSAGSFFHFRGRRGHRISAAGPHIGLAGIVLLTFALTGLGFVPDEAHASGKAYSLKWTAADPEPDSPPYRPTYPKVGPGELDCPTPSGSSGRASDPLVDAVFYAPPANTASDSVSSLAPQTMAVGQIVPFEMEVEVGSGANGDLRVDPYFRTKTTSGSDFGYDPSYGILCAFVDTEDRYDDPAGNGRVSSFSHAIGNSGKRNEQINGKIDLKGMNPGDRVIVEVWVVLKDSIPGGANGNVQSGIDSASEPSSGDKVNVGNQTVPLQKVQDFPSATADVSVAKVDRPDPVVSGGRLAYVIAVRNNSSDTVANGVVVTDRLDPNTSFVLAAGADCSESAGVVTCSVGALGPDERQLISVVVDVLPSAPITDDPSSSPEPGFAGTACPAAGIDLCNRVGVASTTADSNASNNDFVQPTNVIAASVPAAPTITTDASGGGLLGSSTFDTATLSGGSPGNYTGTLTFRLYKNGGCSGPPAFEVTTAVSSGGGSYESPSVTPTRAGRYFWVAEFISSHPDALDAGPTSCNDPAEKVMITPPPATPTITTNASAGGPLGTSVTDTGTLSGGPAGRYRGEIVFKLYDNDSCVGPALTKSTIEVRGDGVYTSEPYKPSVGSYWWVADFDSSSPRVNDSARSACDDPAESVVIDNVSEITDLALSKTGPKRLVPGEKATYFLAVSNVGDVPSTGTVVVTDQLPEGLKPLSARGRDWDCEIVRRTVTCRRSDSLAPGASWPEIEVIAAVDESLQGEVRNSALLELDGDPILSNNEDAVVSRVGSGAPSNDSCIDGAIFAEPEKVFIGAPAKVAVFVDQRNGAPAGGVAVELKHKPGGESTRGKTGGSGRAGFRLTATDPDERWIVRAARCKLRTVVRAVDPLACRPVVPGERELVVPGSLGHATADSRRRC